MKTYINKSKHKFLDLKKIDIGEIVRVEFLDHCEGGIEPIRFLCYGKVLKIAETHIVVGSWVYEGGIMIDNNTTVWTIVNSAIIKIDILE